jgi:sugar transferase (PEP-CTERM system associated)
MIRIFRHFVSVQVLGLLFAEGLMLCTAMYLGIALRFAGGDTYALERILPIFPKALTYAVIMLASMTAFGLYQRDTVLSFRVDFIRYLASLGVGLVLMTLVFYLLPQLFLGRGAFALTIVFSLLGLLVVRLGFLHMVSNESLKRNLLVLGTGTRVARLESLLRETSAGHKFRLVGYLPLGNSQHSVDPSKILPDGGSLLAVASKYQAEEIVVGIRERRGGALPMRDLLDCKLEGIHVTDLSSFFERETGQVQLDSLNPSWMVFSDGFCRSSYRNIVKRGFDIVASLTLLFLTFPVMLVAAALILLESGRPILYRQVRVGECGEPFEVLKFRSMCVNAEGAGAPQWAQQNDSRVTGVGRVIRLLRIDELPQIFNVLRGDMSFVGPRPERPYFVKELSSHIPFYANRHSVKPGITGWAQINYPYGASVKDAREKLQYDLYYAKNHSLFLDLIILVQTVQVILFGKGAR